MLDDHALPSRSLRATTASALSRTVVALAAGAALAFAAPLTAMAHNFVISTTPTEGETLTSAPERFVVTTNDSLLQLGSDGGFAMQVRDADGLFYGDGCVEVEGPSLSMETALGEPGEYTIVWQAVSADAHPIDGTINFVWAPDGEWEAASGSATAPECGVEGEAPEDQETAAPESPTPSDSATDDTSADETNDSADVNAEAGDNNSLLAIIGGAVVLAVIVTVIVLLRRGKGNTTV